MIAILGPIAIGAVLTACLIVATHLLYWRRARTLVARYATGVAAIGAGLSLTGVLLGQYATVAAFWILAGIAGATTLGLHAWRRARGETTDREVRIFAAGTAAGAAGATGEAPR